MSFAGRAYRRKSFEMIFISNNQSISTINIAHIYHSLEEAISCSHELHCHSGDIQLCPGNEKGTKGKCVFKEKAEEPQPLWGAGACRAPCGSR